MRASDTIRKKTQSKAQSPAHATKGAPIAPRKSTDAMSNRTKQRRSGGLTLLLYQRTLHPELFTILGSEQVSRRAYDADVWLVEGGHVIMFTSGKATLTEVINSADPLTDRGLLQSI